MIEGEEDPTFPTTQKKQGVMVLGRSVDLNLEIEKRSTHSVEE